MGFKHEDIEIVLHIGSQSLRAKQREEGKKKKNSKYLMLKYEPSLHLATVRSRIQRVISSNTVWKTLSVSKHRECLALG